MSNISYRLIKKQPSRILNEKPGFLGLTVGDFAVLGYILILSHGFLSTLGFELLAFPITGFLTVSLMSVRLKHRPKVVRDYIIFKLLKSISLKRGLHDSCFR